MYFSLGFLVFLKESHIYVLGGTVVGMARSWQCWPSSMEVTGPVVPNVVGCAVLLDFFASNETFIADSSTASPPALPPACHWRRSSASHVAFTLRWSFCPVFIVFLKEDRIYVFGGTVVRIARSWQCWQSTGSNRASGAQCCRLRSSFQVTFMSFEKACKQFDYIW